MVDTSGFLIDEETVAARLSELLTKIRPFAQIDRGACVHLTREARNLSVKERLRLVLAARWIGNRLEDGIAADVSVADLAMQAGSTRPQVSARIAELVREGFALSTSRGVFRAVPARIESFMEELTGAPICQ
jgi:hypothetical protein